MNIPKTIVLIGWLLLIYNLVAPFSNATLANALNYTLYCIAAVHAVEVIVFQKKIKASTSPSVNTFLVFIFGYFQAIELPEPKA